ncbi:MAG TPA: hypothetical protein VK210_16355 [Terriglobia bacterium]|nr:hypothetical protein [Terriglobia bacterium]
MKHILAASCLLALLSVNGIASEKGPEIQVIDGKVSIHAESVTLSRFLHLLDAATGMTSKVSPEFANQKISVRLDGLDLNTAIRKSFQGQPWNYAIVPGKGITIIDRAQAVNASSGGSMSSPIQMYTSESRSDVPPSPLTNTTPFPQSAPPPAPVNAGGAPAGATGLPAAAGATPTPAPLFQPIGGSLAAPLPSAQPAGR